MKTPKEGFFENPIFWVTAPIETCTRRDRVVFRGARMSKLLVCFEAPVGPRRVDPRNL